MSKMSWGDVKDASGPGTNTNRTESAIAELQEGPNFFRVISEDFYGILMYYAWNRFQKSSDAFDADEIKCPLSKEKDERGIPYRARPYYLFKVIDRRAGKIKILRVGRQVAQMMKSFATSENWGPLTNYDICIQKNSKGAKSLYYMVMPMPKELSKEDKELIANDTLDIEKYSKPANVEWVQKFIAQHKGGAEAPAKTSNKPQPAAKPAAPKKPEPEVTDDFTEESGSVDDDFENL